MAKRDTQSSNTADPSVDDRRYANSSLKIGEFLTYLAPELFAAKGKSEMPDWPADVFAVALALLEKSGGYTNLGTHVRPYGESVRSRDAWLKRTKNAGLKWRRLWIKGLCPPFAESNWQTVMQHWNTPVAEIRNCPTKPELCIALFNLVAITDEAFAGVGLIPFDKRPPAERDFWMESEILLDPEADPESDLEGFEGGSTLCAHLHPTRLRVLPKSQIPISGLSVRSLTSHIALCPPIDIAARWYSQWFEENQNDQGHCNLLLIPWPFEISPTQFRAVSGPLKPSGLAAEGIARWFEYLPNQPSIGTIVSLVEKLVSKAIERVGTLHAVVLPELSLTEEQFDHVCAMLIPKGIGIIAGVLAKNDEDDETWPLNTAVAIFPSEFSGNCRFVQAKHHRWRLDEKQIVRYGLSSQLDPAKDWWEAISVNQRNINFLKLRSWLSVSVLICEDLARVDPVGRFVRTVAPDLVIALLLDGPQLGTRWPAHHAMVLADDPGSSVLTLTSLGMIKLSTMTESIGDECKPVIALWRDPIRGVAEISLPKNAEGAVLTLTRHKGSSAVSEQTADDRKHGLELGSPVYGGITFV